MPEISIDINCDIGENGIGHSPKQLTLLDYVSSGNIATGFHAGDPLTIYKLIRHAMTKGVAIGAHPAYPDRVNFGRKSVKMSPDELYASLNYQVAAMSGMCTSAGGSLHHIKLHGALYHDAHQHEEVAQVVIRFMCNWPKTLMLYGQAGTVLEKMARESKIKWVSEGFMDRRYNSDGQLLSRSHKNGLIEDSVQAIDQALQIIQQHKVKSITGQEVNISAETLCIHGDHSHSLQLAQQLKQALKDQGIVIKSPQL